MKSPYQKVHSGEIFWPFRIHVLKISALLVGLLLVQGLVPTSAQAQMQVKMKALIITAEEDDPSYAGIKTFLQYLGIPFTTLVATKETLTASMLATGSVGNYQAVFLATDNLAFNDSGAWKSAFDPAEWQALEAYEKNFKVRQVTYFTYPTEQFGLSYSSAISVNANPYLIKLTTAGQKYFPYIKPTARIPIRYAYTYLARPKDAGTISLVEDDEGNSIVSVRRLPDGRENLAVTTDNWNYLLHSQLLSYGIIQWAMRGIHLGERTVYLMPQIDDIFLANELFDPALGVSDENRTYRITEKDMGAVESWQTKMRSRRDPSFEDFTLAMVFNGQGAEDRKDRLVRYFTDRHRYYHWINHTYTHPNLDAIPYADALSEVKLNHEWAASLALTKYQKDALVTGQVSGLYNPEAMKAIGDFGIRYVVSDTSKPDQKNPRPNIGIYSVLNSLVLEIPRRPTNIFVPASTVEEEVGLYNKLYRDFWGRDFSYEEILDFESEMILGYMASYDIGPLMFHQSNLRAYDGRNFLLGDLITKTMDKYASYVNLPVISPSMSDLGRRMAQRMAYDEAGVEAHFVVGQGIRLTAAKPAVVPLTGLQYGRSATISTFSPGTYRIYGAEKTSWIQLIPGQSMWIPWTGCPGDWCMATTTTSTTTTTTTTTVKSQATTTTLRTTSSGSSATTPAGAKPVKFILIDKDSIAKDQTPVDFSEQDINFKIKKIGLRTPLPYFTANVGKSIDLSTGRVSDEGWFAPKQIPRGWASEGPTADGLRNYLGDPGMPYSHNVGKNFTQEGNDSQRKTLLEKVPEVIPLRAEGLKGLVGSRVCAMVFDTDIRVSYSPLNANLNSSNLGTVAFEVLGVTQAPGYLLGNLPTVKIKILDTATTCRDSMTLYSQAPIPVSSMSPYDVKP